MAINAVCPACRAVYNLVDQQQGKRVRCKHCDAVFVVGETPPTKTAKPPTVEFVEQPQPRPPAAVTARRAKPAKVVREEEDSKPRRGQGGGNALPWLIGGGVAALAIIVTGVIVVVLLLREGPSKVASNNALPTTTNQPEVPAKIEPQPLRQPPVPSTPNQPSEGRPVAQPDKPTLSDVKPSSSADPAPAPASNGKLSDEALNRVKRATVYLRVTMPDGSKASGTGFFGSTEARNIILTNAHVIGMLAPESRRPRLIEVFVNSGQIDEWKTGARVLGVDRSSDLAVLDIGTPPKPTPDPLIVKSAAGLRELHSVYVFGFPFGEQLGKEITIRDASVSSLRKKGGVLDRVQVNGGMDPGNSGGPVVDSGGYVVGVAVSGIPGRQINFAIPGDRVHIILDGRISALGIHQPFFVEDNRIAVPVVMEMIDPRNLIKKVGIEVWSGDKPVNTAAAHRPPATTQPGRQSGDSERRYHELDYKQGEGRKDIKLPELPPGKVWWQQPMWVNAKGQTHWASAHVLNLPTSPVERKPARLVLNYPARAVRPLKLTMQNILKVSNDDDSDTFRMKTEVEFLEKVNSTGPTGSVLSLQYRGKDKIKREFLTPGSPPRSSKLLASIRDYLPSLQTILQIDSVGNIIKQDPKFLGRIDPSRAQAMRTFHLPIQQGLEAMAVSLPAKGMVNPLDSWKAERHLPIDTPGKYQSGKLDMTFTYLGVRKRDGRDEAVLNIDGMVRGDRGAGDAISGKATGKVLVDLLSGQTILAEVKVVLDLDALVSEPGEAPRQLKVIATLQVRLERKL
jgi:predicted Zn finger-like uncharacterized protein